MDVDVQKARDRNPVGGADLVGTSGKSYAAAWTDGFEDTVANQDSSVTEFCLGSQGAADVKKGRGHG